MNEPNLYVCEHNASPHVQCKWCCTKIPVDKDGLCFQCFEIIEGVGRLARTSQAARTALWQKILRTPLKETDDAANGRSKVG